MKPDGSGVRRLTRFADSDSVHASWSPGGTRIAFERDFQAKNLAQVRVQSPTAVGAGIILQPTGQSVLTRLGLALYPTIPFHVPGWAIGLALGVAF